MIDPLRQLGQGRAVCDAGPGVEAGRRKRDQGPLSEGHSGTGPFPSRFRLTSTSAGVPLNSRGFSVSAGRPRHDSLRRPTPSPLTKAVAATARTTPARAGRKTGSLDTRGTPAVVSGRHTAPDSTVAVDDSRQAAGGWFGPMGCPSGV